MITGQLLEKQGITVLEDESQPFLREGIGEGTATGDSRAVAPGSGNRGGAGISPQWEKSGWSAEEFEKEQAFLRSGVEGQ